MTHVAGDCTGAAGRPPTPNVAANVLKTTLIAGAGAAATSEDRGGDGELAADAVDSDAGAVDACKAVDFLAADADVAGSLTAFTRGGPFAVAVVPDDDAPGRATDDDAGLACVWVAGFAAVLPLDEDDEGAGDESSSALATPAPLTEAAASPSATAPVPSHL